jgi:hypothetical protein
LIGREPAACRGLADGLVALSICCQRFKFRMCAIEEAFCHAVNVLREPWVGSRSNVELEQG